LLSARCWAALAKEAALKEARLVSGHKSRSKVVAVDVPLKTSDGADGRAVRWRVWRALLAYRE